MHHSNWMRSIRSLNTSQQLKEFITLWTKIQQVSLDPNIQDDIVWTRTPNGEYSSKSAYLMQFQGSIHCSSGKLIWQARTENKCKFFAWTLSNDKILTADNLAKRGWPHHPLCSLCNQAPETSSHLCLMCPYALQTWTRVFSLSNCNILSRVSPQNFSTFMSWWQQASLLTPKGDRKNFNGLVIYIVWNIWKERNRRIFQQVELTSLELASKIREDINSREQAFLV